MRESRRASTRTNKSPRLNILSNQNAVLRPTVESCRQVQRESSERIDSRSCFAPRFDQFPLAERLLFSAVKRRDIAFQDKMLPNRWREDGAEDPTAIFIAVIVEKMRAWDQACRIEKRSP